MSIHKVPKTTTSRPAVIGTDGREAYPRFWVALYTRPKSEKKTALELTRHGIEIYAPLQVQMRQWSDRKKKIEVPVIPMIVFAFVDDSQLKEIQRHPLILKILTKPGDKTAARIPAEQIERLKLILGQTDVVVEFDPQAFEINDVVEITRGHFKGLKGEIHDCPDGVTELIVRIELLGGAKLKINKRDLIHIK